MKRTIKSIIANYKLGKFITSNLELFPDFEILNKSDERDFLIRKQSEYILQYLSKIHTISYLKNKTTFISIAKLEEEPINKINGSIKKI